MRSGSPGALSLLELQHLAGNRAVVEALGRSRSGGRQVAAVGRAVAVTIYDPPDGVTQIRAKKPGMTFAYTLTLLEVDSPPLLRPAAPVKTAEGWTCRAEPTRVPKPDFEVGVPKDGRYQLNPIRFLDVTPDWATKLREGEDEHVSDGTLAWERTWGLVGEAINELAKEPGPPQKSEDEARQDLWRRFRERLPGYLRPEGSAPTAEAQMDRWGWKSGTLFRKLMKATELRDTGANAWHLPEVEPVEIKSKFELTTLAKGKSRIGEVSSAELLDSVVPPK